MSLKENGCPGEGSQIPNAVVYHDTKEFIAVKVKAQGRGDTQPETALSAAYREAERRKAVSA